jgi:hypothetical protein
VALTKRINDYLIKDKTYKHLREVGILDLN